MNADIYDLKNKVMDKVNGYNAVRPVQPLIGVIMVCLILYICLWIQARYTESELLQGFWKADSDFCQETGLDLFIMYIGPMNYMTHHNCYIIAKNEDGLIINDDATLKIYSVCINPLVSNHKKYYACFEWTDEETDYEHFPKKQMIHYYPKQGKLIISKDDVVSAILYKDNDISDQMRITPEELEESDSDEED